MITISINNEDEGMRIDRFIGNKTDLTHVAICKLIRERKIFIDDMRICKPGDKISPNAKMVHLHTSLIFYKTNSKKELFNVAPKMITNIIKKSVVYEDSYILAINKPPGLASQSGGSLKYSLDDIMKHWRKNDAKIVHRLDKETSGLMIMAKNRHIASMISNAFKDRKVKKAYFAILSPIPLQSTGIINTNNKKTVSNTNKYEAVSCDDAMTKIAITKYVILNTDADKNIALVKFMPQTGRTHQLRVHAAHINCPIVGDSVYGGNLSLSKSLQLFSYQISLPLDIYKNCHDAQHIMKDSDIYFKSKTHNCEISCDSEYVTITCNQIPDFFLIYPCNALID